MTSVEVAIEKLTALCFFVTDLSHILASRVWVRFFITLREKGEVGCFLNALIHFPLGALIVSFHNVWHGIPLIVTLIGWGLTLKSTIYFLFPRYGLKMLGTISMERPWHFSVAGVFSVLLAAVIYYPLL